MIKIQGHRGFSEKYPESTELAYRKTIESGVFGMEMDIRKTVDGVFVVIHDGTVDRTTNGTGAVANLTWDYIRSLDAGAWFDSSFANREDCKVMSLDQYIEKFKDADIMNIMHICISDPVDIRAIVDKVELANMMDKTHFFGDTFIINPVKAYKPNAFTQNSAGKFINNYQSDLDNAIANNHNSVSINAGNSLADMTTMVQNIHSHGKLAHISTLSSDYEMYIKRAIDSGVDFVLGNDPLLMQQIANRLTQPNEPPPIKPADALVLNNDYLKINDGQVKARKYIRTTDGFISVVSYIGD